MIQNRNLSLLEENTVVLVVIDVQGNLAMAMHGRERLFDNLVRLITGIQVFSIPILWTEQNPKKLGPTIPSIAQAMPNMLHPIPKLSFSCFREKAFADALIATQRFDVVVAGIEAHICVYQTAFDLMSAGYRVHVIADGVASRTPKNCSLALQCMRDAGARLTSVEMLLFELLKTADSDRFKEIARIVK
ncbi:MAG: hydrolase [Desulfobacterota bacterium]|nr:hydrolase [Thermodesulfobacteriota bacterium]